MTKPMKATEAYASLHSRMIQEVRSAPVDTPEDDVWLMVAGAQSDVMGLLGLSDRDLYPHLDDLRRISRAINQRITGMED